MYSVCVKIPFFLCVNLIDPSNTHILQEILLRRPLRPPLLTHGHDRQHPRQENNLLQRLWHLPRPLRHHVHHLGRRRQAQAPPLIQPRPPEPPTLRPLREWPWHDPLRDHNKAHWSVRCRVLIQHQCHLHRRFVTHILQGNVFAYSHHFIGQCSRRRNSYYPAGISIRVWYKNNYTEQR